MTDPGTTISTQPLAPNLAVDLLPEDSPDSFQLDVSDLDGLDLLGYGPSSWVNIVCNVRSVRATRGATRLQGALTRTEAGTAVVALEDTDRRFDPMVNADAVHPGVPFRVRAWSADVVEGVIEQRRNLVPTPWPTTNTAPGWSRRSGTGGVTAAAVVDTPAGAGWPQGVASLYRVSWTTAPTAAGGAAVGSTTSDPLAVKVTAGQQVTGSLYVRPSAATSMAAGFIFTNDAGTTVTGGTYGTTTACNATTATRLAVTNTVPAGATRAQLIADQRSGALWTVGATLLAGAAQVEVAATASGYFDGGSAAVGTGLGAVTYEWTATAGASPSRQLYAVGEAAWDEVLFTGMIGADLDVQYQKEGPPLVSFTAVDAVAPLAQYRSMGRPDPGAGAGDSLRQRVVRVLTETGSTAQVAAGSDAVYQATLAPSALAGGWDDVNAAVDAELGRVWVARDGTLVVRGRGSELDGTVLGTLSDVHGETVAGTVHCCYQDAAVRFGTDGLVNRAIGARRVPGNGNGTTPPASAVVQVDDTDSQARWTVSTPVAHEDRGLELETDAQLLPWAQWLVLDGATPELRVDSVTVAPNDSPDAWRAVCQTDVGSRWYFRLHPEVGPAVARTLGVLGVTHDVTPEGWTTTWLTVEAPTPGVNNPRGWFVLDTSLLDEGDVLPPFAGPLL